MYLLILPNGSIERCHNLETAKYLKALMGGEIVPAYAYEIRN